MESWLEPIYDAEGMRATDAWAIEEQGVPSLGLMEAAGEALAGAVEREAAEGPVRVVCGKGNNGGDGLVAARHLAAAGHDVETLLLWPATELAGDAAANLARLDGAYAEVSSGDLAAALQGSGAVVDAILGTGFSGAPRQPVADAVEAINRCGAPVVSADIASGVAASSGEVEGAAVRATVTVGFHAAKLGHWVAPGKEHAGRLEVAEIGIPAGAPAAARAGLINDGVLAALPRRGAASTKFSSGQVVVVGGSRGLTGAVCLAAEAATRAGAGYATVAVPAGLETVFEVKLTEVMSHGFEGADDRLAAADADAIAAACERAAAVALGPGLGRDPDSLALARRLATVLSAPLVLDADGLNAHAQEPEALAARDAPTVITPHEGEMARLLGRDADEVRARRLAAATEASDRAGAVVVLKGDDTLVVDSERLAVARGGAPALATAGSGDVLTGLIAALLARGLGAFEAACAGVHAHQRAGRAAATRVGLAESVVASDVVSALPEALA